LGLRASKGRGQHFLVDPGVLETILASVELGRDDVVVEVGPGLGVLTGELASRVGRLIAVEVDSALAEALVTKLAGVPAVEVQNADILDLEPGALVGTSEADAVSSGYKVVANLPYSVASPILRHFLETSVKPSVLVVMVQKEVGESIAAKPGAMSLLSVSVQLYGKPRIVGHVPALAFHPQPKVDSVIVRIDVYQEPAVQVDDIAGFFHVVRAGFSAPRKQLRNSLSIGLGVDGGAAADLLHEAGIDPERRPGTVSLEEWGGLFRAFARRGER
jgi:16S rRNA (adenine1518-N6/adenine1519-N6)-dimethyltransferase